MDKLGRRRIDILPVVVANLDEVLVRFGILVDIQRVRARVS